MDERKKSVIINELIVSLQHAVITCRTSNDIVEAFSNFYEDDEVLEARNVILKLNGQRATSRKADKKKLVAECLDYVRKEDFKGKNLEFGATNVFKICNVHAGIGEDLRQEIAEVRAKYESLTRAIGELKTLSNGLENVASDLKTFHGTVHSPTKPTKPSYLKIANTGIKMRHISGSSRPVTPVSPPISQKIAMQRDAGNVEDGTDMNQEPFTLVKRKKNKSSSRVTGVGGTADSNVKSVPKPRVGLLFLSRCTPETTCDDIGTHIFRSVKSFKLLDVETWKTKYNTYSSFKISFNLETEKLSAFLKETVTAELWPAGSLIKPFGLKKLLKPSNTQV
ncbi:unnamed protein product [Orchesella dallaii]|uniref:Uncharacterized protein n=1 Tax=Orchesella dallaii TaxID=48710 RepID=A0ABP1RZQ8_9HEXA